ncbi:MAG: LuxR C-terminal-related transcriptional regulator [Saprospiraceae bacterium]|nr:LuxR C-terminal-related transcriptional regulator [Saprospiraceae bacterium]
MSKSTVFEHLQSLQEAERIYQKVRTLSSHYYKDDEIADMDGFVREAKLLLDGIKGTEAVISIFNHKKYISELDVGKEAFWGVLPEGTEAERMSRVLSLLEKGYESFPTDSVAWLTSALSKIPFEQRSNIKICYCGIRYRKMDGKPLCLFSQGVPIQYDKERNFTYTFNYIQNVAYLIKKDFAHYWIRVSYGEENKYVYTFHSATKEDSNRDLLSSREKEVLTLIAQDLDTKEISNQLFISPNTVGHHRSNMIEYLGARDTTALVQLAKMAGMI